MSILIKGMEMPQICFKCKLSRITPSIYIFCPLNEKCYPADEMPSDCPLVPVPPHGDLIDQDEYRDEFMNGVYALCADDPDNYRANAIIDLFDAAPTIIPAEEGE